MNIMKEQITRVHPIRTTKKQWTIPMYCRHACNLYCSKIYSRDQSNLNIYRYFLVNNPIYNNGKCIKYDCLESTFIRLSSFNIENPTGATGPLYESDSIVIPDTNISVLLTYPLSTPVNVNIISPTSRGFTLKHLIYSIKMVYQYIYSEEERTSTPRSYHIKKRCTVCLNKNKDYVNDIELSYENTDNECSICYTKYSLQNSSGQLLCKHIFHKNCIQKWLETSNTCPLCRKYIGKCDACNGSEFIYYGYDGVVIPIEHRGAILNRNTTDGIFGIFGHDIEDLIIENIHYDREARILTLNIGS